MIILLNWNTYSITVNFFSQGPVRFLLSPGPTLARPCERHWSLFEPVTNFIRWCFPYESSHFWKLWTITTQKLNFKHGFNQDVHWNQWSMSLYWRSLCESVHHSTLHLLNTHKTSHSPTSVHIFYYIYTHISYAYLSLWYFTSLQLELQLEYFILAMSFLCLACV